MEQKLFDKLMDLAQLPDRGHYWPIGSAEARSILRWGGIPLDHAGTVFEATGTNERRGVEGAAIEPGTPRERAEKRLRTAWEKLNAEEVEKVVPKAIEYGSGDLKLMGYAMKMLLNSPRARQRDWTEAESMEIAIAFYTLGKVAREFSAFEMGNMPSDDQPHDIGVYQRMAQVIRREGSWPPGFDEFLKEKE